MPKYGGKSLAYVNARYTSVGTLATSIISAFNVTTFGGAVTAENENLIGYTSTNGRFTVQEAGLYAISMNAFILGGGTSGIMQQYDIQVNGSTTIWSASTFLHISLDTIERTAFVVTELQAGDYIRVLIQGPSGQTIRLQTGTHLNMWKVR